MGCCFYCFPSVRKTAGGGEGVLLGLRAAKIQLSVVLAARGVSLTPLSFGVIADFSSGLRSSPEYRSVLQVSTVSLLFLLQLLLCVRDLGNHVSCWITEPQKTQRIRSQRVKYDCCCYCFVVGLVHVGVLKKKDGFLPAVFNAGKARGSKQGSLGCLVKFSNHLIYTRSCLSPATGLVARENSRSHTHEINLADLHTIGRDTVMCKFCFFWGLP